MINTYANWPAPANVHALTTERMPGVSLPPYDGNNLAMHVGDNPTHVQTNRLTLNTVLMLPSTPEWLEQIHSTLCVVVEDEPNRQADAAITRQSRRVLAIMSADCQPILLCNQQGSEIAAIHAGWRGLAEGIIENTVARMQSDPHELLAWIGPAICCDCFEVDNDVRDIYMNRYPFSVHYFKPFGKKWLGDLAGITMQIFNHLFITQLFYSNACTFEQKDKFFSYRRESQTGRIASLIWFQD